MSVVIWKISEASTGLSLSGSIVVADELGSELSMLLSLRDELVEELSTLALGEHVEGIDRLITEWPALPMAAGAKPFSITLASRPESA